MNKDRALQLIEYIRKHFDFNEYGEWEDGNYHVSTDLEVLESFKSKFPENQHQTNMEQKESLREQALSCCGTLVIWEYIQELENRIAELETEKSCFKSGATTKTPIDQEFFMKSLQADENN